MHPSLCSPSSQESMSHPDRYTEQFMAVSVVQPLLGALAYLHDQKITHR